MIPDELDARLRPLFDEIQKARTYGLSHEQLLQAFELAIGRSDFRRLMDKQKNAKLQASDRPERKKFPWSLYKRLYERQAGLCPWCCGAMILLRGKVEIDHINPNADDYNGRDNLQLLHSHCNREKSGMSIEQQSKHTGKSFVELIGQPVEEDA
jgi:hypothetical protein